MECCLLGAARGFHRWSVELTLSAAVTVMVSEGGPRAEVLLVPALNMSGVGVKGPRSLEVASLEKNARKDAIDVALLRIDGALDSSVLTSDTNSRGWIFKMPRAMTALLLSAIVVNNVVVEVHSSIGLNAVAGPTSLYP